MPNIKDYTLSSGRQLHISDLYNEEAVQSAYHCLVDVINFQSSRIQDLETHIVTLGEDSQAIKQLHQSVDVKLQQLSALVQQLQHQRECDVKDAETQLASITSMQARLEQKANQVDVVNAMHSIENTTTGLFQNLKKECANTELLSRLQQQVNTQHDQLVALETRVDCKVDKSQQSQLNSTVAKIYTFESDCSNLRHDIETLQQSHEKQLQELHKLTERSITSNDDLRAIKEIIKTKADLQHFERCRHQLLQHRLQMQNNIQEMTKQLQNYEENVDTTEAHIREMSDSLQRIYDSTETKFDQLKKLMEAGLATKAPLEESMKMFCDIRDELNCKSWQKDVSEVIKCLRKLEKNKTLIERQVQLLSQFVRWYSRRETYEHNIEVIEARIDNLMNDPAFRCPKRSLRSIY